MTDTFSITRHVHRKAMACCAAVMAFGWPATALAAPDDGYWDIEEYDNCIQNTPPTVPTPLVPVGPAMG